MGIQLLAVLNAEQPRGEAGIQKIQLGRFNQTFIEVAVMRWQQMHDITGFQHGYPGFGGVMRHATVAGQGGQIEQLPGAARAQFQKALKAGQILHFDQLPHIPFQVSARIVPIPDMGFEVAVEDGREGAIEQYFIEVAAHFFSAF